MYERDIYIQYQLAIDQHFKLSDFNGFRSGGHAYVLVPTHICTMYDPSEIMNITQFLHYTGDQSVAQLVPTLNNQYEAVIDGNPIYLFRIPRIKAKEEQKSFGKQLAAFHKLGSTYHAPQPEMSRSGRWAELWGTRVDDIKSMHTKLVQSGGSSSFDQIFMDTFPYYEGLAENAIQYIVDSNIDSRNNMWSNTITHQRLKQNTLIKLGDDFEYVKLPVHFVCDDPMRDVTEWIRNMKQDTHGDEEIELFLKDYYAVQRFSIEDIRKIYGRLLFPISYLDTIESYYITKRNTVKEHLQHELNEIIKAESENESFLRDFLSYFGMNRSRANIPQIEWLKA